METSLPEVSVILPILNEEQNLTNCISAILNQDYGGQIEVILALGPSKDKTNEIAKKLQNSQLLILSSFIENSPCVIGEAHCCGLPVVATDVGGVKELIMEGAVVPPKSPELLAAKILEQLDKKVDRAALSQKAQARFSYDAIGQQIFDVYKKICVE